jgi:thiamine kinase-like enzyme
VQDRFFRLDYKEGPFLTIKSFNDWLLAAATRQRPRPEGITGPYRDFFPDTGNVYFTHRDLTLGNIIISGPPGSQRITGIVDWEQAGWYPEYWEYCKLLYGVEYSHEWRSAGWTEKVMKSYDDEWAAFAEYSS